MLQVFLNVVLWGMDPQSAVEAPRFATYSFPSSSEPHAYHPGRLNLESRIGKSTVDTLAKLGHEVSPWTEIEWRAGAVCAIRVNESTGLLEGAADPRRPCYALGV
jgi:gamma-glutamyltranspeptidase/glutathione hydrolase